MKFFCWNPRDLLIRRLKRRKRRENMRKVRVNISKLFGEIGCEIDIAETHRLTMLFNELLASQKSECLSVGFEHTASASYRTHASNYKQPAIHKLTL
jgi:hypothetical protein